MSTCSIVSSSPTGPVASDRVTNYLVQRGRLPNTRLSSFLAWQSSESSHLVLASTCLRLTLTSVRIARHRAQPRRCPEVFDVDLAQVGPASNCQAALAETLLEGRPRRLWQSLGAHLIHMSGQVMGVAWGLPLDFLYAVSTS